MAADADAPVALDPWSTDTGRLLFAEPTPFSELPPIDAGPSIRAAESTTPSQDAGFSLDPVSSSVERVSPATPGGHDVPHSAALEDVARQADRHTRHGYELAGRGAFFAARSEFLAALRLVAEGLDAEDKNTSHTRSLAMALKAVKEAEDFLPRGTSMKADLELPRILETHGTPVLKNQKEGLAPLIAMKRYLTFAQEQLAAAACHEVAGAMALHGLGKLHATGNKNVRIAAAEPKAIVYYQASLLVYANNFMAANDLGVLLAKCGNYAQARAMLEYSLSLRAAAIGWQNLSVVYRQLGESALAAHAGQQAARIREAEVARRRSMQMPVQDKVRWLDAATFAQTSTNTPNSPDAVRPAARVATQQSQPMPAGQAIGTPSPGAGQTTTGWFPWGSQNTRR